MEEKVENAPSSVILILTRQNFVLETAATSIAPPSPLLLSTS